MSKSVVLAEKPSVARDIARVLKCSQKHNGFFEGSQYVVTWALGHLVTLADPEVYDDKYKSWQLDHLPMLPNPLQLVVIKQSGKQYQTVKTQLQRKDIQRVIIATDAGREGELVARWILEKAKVNKPVDRLWISSVTDKAIREGFQKLKPGKSYENLYASAAARAEADWIVGMNGTRALTTKYNAQLSCGRVQTPTLAMIAKREEQIRTFQPVPFYRILAHSRTGMELHWQHSKSGDTRIFDQTEAKRLLSHVSGKPGQVARVQKTAKKSYAPGLYDLTELQREANQRYGYSAKETLSIMQRLYEQHKVLTYPRTDSRFLSSDIVPTLKDRVKASAVGSFASAASELLRSGWKTGKSFVNDEKVSDHHAIIPTEEPVRLQQLNEKERKIYELVVSRFLAVLSPPFEYEQTTVEVKIGSETFVGKGKRVLSEGWKRVYGSGHDDLESDQDDDIRDQRLPKVEQGDQLVMDQVRLKEGKTKPPEPFTEGTLLSAMEKPAQYLEVSDQRAARTLGETGGLGTVATRADIIEKLVGTFLIEKRGKHLHITSKGKQLLDLVPDELRSPLLTAEWEQKLSDIASGKLKKQQFVSEMRNYAVQVVQEVKTAQKQFKHDNVISSKCPDCGKPMLEVNGKRGKMHVCQDRECGFRKQIARTSNARCPQCRKKLELRGEGEGQIFVCRCGYREKLSSFQERRGKEKEGKASKRDVQAFLREQNKQEEPVNNALAEALKKLKLDK
ncbi:DNA topoisomerase III [Marinicrinis sediminis]|uniref:DNA topoisomerase 3 n=1 Tax=Marinicrinis sediminis TaxID=1652465 RepID=A0ABW5REW7_9BACL